MPGSRVCLADREEIRAGLERGDSIRVIARFLGRAASTISREIQRNRSRRGYVAHVAHRRARQRARRPKPLMLVTDAQLRGRVIAKLDQKLSPRVIALQLRSEGFSVSPETIYRACYHPDRPLGDDAHRYLCRPRRGRVRRRRTSTGRDPKPLGQIRSVHDRRATPPDEAGHWEGDLLVGKQNAASLQYSPNGKPVWCDWSPSLKGAAPIMSPAWSATPSTRSQSRCADPSLGIKAENSPPGLDSRNKPGSPSTSATRDPLGRNLSSKTYAGYFAAGYHATNPCRRTRPSSTTTPHSSTPCPDAASETPPPNTDTISLLQQPVELAW